MALTQKLDLRPKLVSFEGDQNRKRERGRREEEEEEEEEKKKKGGGVQEGFKGMELYGFVWISCLDMCLWVVGCRKPNPRMNLCIEIITNPFVSLGFCYEMT